MITFEILRQVKEMITRLVVKPNKIGAVHFIKDQ